MPYYHCTHCGFTFIRQGKATECPDCGKEEVRPALKAEIEEFKKIQKEEKNNA